MHDHAQMGNADTTGPWGASIAGHHLCLACLAPAHPGGEVTWMAGSGTWSSEGTSAIRGKKGEEVMRGEALGRTAPDTLPDAREGRVQIAYREITQRYLCGHLHASQDEAGRCAGNMAVRLSSRPMPSNYYLG